MEDGEPAAPAPTRTPPGPMMRFLVVVFGVIFFGIGRAVQNVGGVLGLVLGVLMQLVGIAVVLIAIGAVEWVARRRRGRPQV